MPIPAFLAVAAAILVHRVLMLTLPFFAWSVAHAPVVNWLCGTLSDLSLVFLVAAPLPLLVSRSIERPPLWRRPLVVAYGLLCLGLTVVIAIELRYAEHFGQTVRPYHLTALNSDGMVSVGASMTLQSWRSLLAMALALAAFGGAWWRGLGRASRLPLAPKWRWATALALLVGAAAANGATNMMRNLPGLHSELRYNVASAFYYNAIDLAQFRSLPPPSKDELRMLRELFPGTRQWDSGPDAEKFSLWQTSIASAASDSNSPEIRWRDAVRRHLAAEASAHGPWNVVLVLSESIRAEELTAWGNQQEHYAAMTPNLSRIAHGGMRFQEVINAGMRTHYGQSAAGCSVYGPEAFTLVGYAPMTRAVCLSDVLGARGYETHFFYGAANNYDNHEVFYSLHGVGGIHGEEEFPPGTPRGGWGVSDRALFQKALATLDAAREPFFATILTLSAHGPFRLPDDAPPSIDRNGEILDQLLQYVDWSTGEFYDELIRRHPRTLFVLVADHGYRRGEAIGSPDEFAGILRRQMRIPWLISVPSLPTELRGFSTSKLVSNVDVPPTILSLLGITEIPNQFMGEDAFARTEPIYMSLDDAVLRMTHDDIGALTVQRIPQGYVDTLGKALRYDLLAPPESGRQ